MHWANDVFKFSFSKALDIVILLKSYSFQFSSTGTKLHGPNKQIMFVSASNVKLSIFQGLHKCRH